jgi:hypothetical protein
MICAIIIALIIKVSSLGTQEQYPISHIVPFALSYRTEIASENSSTQSYRSYYFELDKDPEAHHASLWLLLWLFGLGSNASSRTSKRSCISYGRSLGFTLVFGRLDNSNITQRPLVFSTGMQGSLMRLLLSRRFALVLRKTGWI